MGRQRRSFTREFKIKVAQAASADLSKMQEVAADHSVRPALVMKWVTMLNAGGPEALQDSHPTSDQVQASRTAMGQTTMPTRSGKLRSQSAAVLYEQIGRLTVENAILKDRLMARSGAS